MCLNNNEISGKTFVRIEGEEHNLFSLLELFREKGIIIDTIISSDKREDSINRITGDFIPALDTRLTLVATYEQVRNVLDSSDEFMKYSDKIIGTL